MRKKSSQQQTIYVRPEWRIRTSFFILLLMIALELLVALFQGSVQREGGFLLLLSIIQFSVFFLIPLYVATVRHKQPPQALGIPEKPFFRGLGKGLLWGAMLFVLNMFAAYALILLFPEHTQDTQMIIQAMLEENNSFEFFGLIVCITVLAPVGEEIFFRAFMMGALEARFGSLAGVLISSFVFGAMHEGMWDFFPFILPIFLSGCGFALLYIKYRDVYLNIIAHAAYNCIVVFLMFGARG